VVATHGSGRNTATINTGHATASSRAFCAGQEVPTSSGTLLPNSSRVAATVADSGFHSATVPSHGGISDGETNVLEIIVSGKSSAQVVPAASSLTMRPR